jgi:large subunit ribosomal protein L30
MSKKFNVKLIKSKRGCTATQLRTLEALGLGKISDKATLVDNKANRGQIIKVQHLIDVEVVG